MTDGTKKDSAEESFKADEEYLRRKTSCREAA